MIKERIIIRYQEYHIQYLITLYIFSFRARIMRWVFWSVMFGVVGGLLCKFSDGGYIPVNKNLWSVSYCLVTSSMAFFIQAILYFVVDLKNKWGGRPLYYAGRILFITYIRRIIQSKKLKKT